MRLGILLVVLGATALASSILLTIASVLFVACLMIAGGILQTAHALLSQRWGGNLNST